MGLLAGENDMERMEPTRQGRNINRHSYTLIKSANTRLILEWALKKHTATAYIDVKTCRGKIVDTGPVAARTAEYDV